MKFATFFVVFVALTGRISLSRILIEPNKPDGFVELEEAAVSLVQFDTIEHCFPSQMLEKVYTQNTRRVQGRNLSTEMKYMILERKKEK